MGFVKINGALINTTNITSAKIESRDYMNGSSHWLVVTLAGGGMLRWEHRPPFNAFEELKRLEEALAP